MANLIHTIKESRVGVWLQDAPVKQKVTLVIGGVFLIGALGLGIHQAFKSDDAPVAVQTVKTEMTVESNGIKSTTSTTASDTNVEAVITPYVPPTTDTIEDSGPMESNAATVDVPEASEETYYTGENGGRYEGADPGYVETEDISVPVETAAPANGGWDGNLNAPMIDSTGAVPGHDPVFGNQ